MLDLKPYYDAVNATAAEVQRIAAELDALFREGTDESKLKALDLRPALDAAQTKNAEAESLYAAMQKANRPNEIARNFVPISSTSPEPDQGSQTSVINRHAYDGLSLVERARFIRSGGTVED
jgi:hypothetical protein